jgi:hypothetical protein
MYLRKQLLNDILKIIIINVQHPTHTIPLHSNTDVRVFVYILLRVHFFLL